MTGYFECYVADPTKLPSPGRPLLIDRSRVCVRAPAPKAILLMHGSSSSPETPPPPPPPAAASLGPTTDYCKPPPPSPGHTVSSADPPFPHVLRLDRSPRRPLPWGIGPAGPQRSGRPGTTCTSGRDASTAPTAATSTCAAGGPPPWSVGEGGYQSPRIPVGPPTASATPILRLCLGMDRQWSASKMGWANTNAAFLPSTSLRTSLEQGAIAGI